VRIGILGGTGKEGQGLALRWASQGVEVLLGSRDPAKAERIAEKLNIESGWKAVRGMENREVAAEADAVVSALPASGHREALNGLVEELRDKLLIVATVVWPPRLAERPSAAEEVQDIVSDTTQVVAAFQTVSALSLRALDKEVDDDVLVLGDCTEARQLAVNLIRRAGLRGVEAGPLGHTRIIEAMTRVLIEVNKNYGIRSAGLRITGLENKDCGETDSCLE